MASSEPDLHKIHDFLIELAQKAGQMITSARPSMGAVDTKKNSSDLVTETDKAVEAFISSSLSTAFPSYSFLGEETSQSGTLTPSPTFVVDPIDGTTNFVHGYPYVSISLAFCYHSRPLVGIVYNPFTGYLYHAVRGSGAYLTTALPAGTSITVSSDPSTSSTNPSSTNPSTNPTPGTTSNGKELTRRLPLRPSPPLTTISKSLICIEWGNERSGTNWETKIATFAALAGAQETGGKMAHSLRSLGSAALNLCSVAAGEMDAYWEGGAWAWDVAAGWCILEEAGGKVVGANKGELEVPVDGRRYLAVRGAEGGSEEQDRFVEEFWGCVRGRLEY